MSLPFQCVYFPRVFGSRAESLYIIRRLTVGSGPRSAGPHRGWFHQTAPALPARHIQDAILMWLSFEKNTRLVIVMTSPPVPCRCWLKSLFWLLEFCQWDTRSWNRSLWSFLTNTPPPQLHMSWWRGAPFPLERLLHIQMPANAASYCCGSFINILTEQDERAL